MEIIQVKKEAVIEYLDRAVSFYLEKNTEPGEEAISAAQYRQTTAFGKIQCACALDLISLEEKYQYYKKINLEL